MDTTPSGNAAPHGDPPADGAPARPGSRPRVRRFTTYKERVRGLSERLVEAQRPIRILDAVKWSDETYDQLKAQKYRELPKVDAEYYRARPLAFEPESKLEELALLAKDVERDLGASDPLGAILLRNTRQYESVVHMLQARGTPRFYEISRELYGSPKDTFLDGQTTIRDLGLALYAVLQGLQADRLGVEYRKTMTAEECVERLNEGFRRYFLDDEEIHAKLDDGIVSDAAAGASYVKVHRGVMFSPRDVELLEIHEGWVHVGTSQNGRLQHVASWLGKGPPCTTAMQEGLAVLMEVTAFVSQPARAQRLNNRIIAIDKVEDGADFLDLLEFYRTEGLPEERAVGNAQRVFRGGVVEGGAPFTKDVTYCKGFVENYNFIQSCIALGRPELVPFMFVGKVTIEDVPVLYEQSRRGVIDPPRYLPRHFRDLNALAVWMAYSNFFNRIDLAAVHKRLAAVIRGVG